MASHDINLLKAKTTLSTQQLAILDHLQKVGVVVIIATIFGGVLTGSLYYLMSTQLTRAENRKTELLRQVAGEARKEALLVSLKERLPVIRKAIDNAEDWGEIVSLIPQIAFVPALKSVSVDDKNITQMTIQTDTLDETAGVVNEVISLVRQRRIHNPQLVGLQINDDGTVQMTVSFLPIF